MTDATANQPVPEHPLRKFQEKYATQKSEPSQPRQHSKRNKVIALIVMVAVLFGLVGAVALALNKTSTDQAGAAAVVDNTDVTPRAWHGSVLPISESAGPAEFSETSARGFSQTEFGAALAALHISTRLDPYAGPSVFTPALENQFLSENKEPVLKLMKAEYDKAVKTTGTTPGQPVLTQTGEMVAFRVDGGFNPDARNIIEVYVKRPTTDDVVYGIPVQWHNGDWKIAPGANDEGFGFTKSSVDESATYTAFFPDN